MNAPRADVCLKINGVIRRQGGVGLVAVVRTQADGGATGWVRIARFSLGTEGPVQDADDGPVVVRIRRRRRRKGRNVDVDDVSSLLLPFLEEFDSFDDGMVHDEVDHLEHREDTATHEEAEVTAEITWTLRGGMSEWMNEWIYLFNGNIYIAQIRESSKCAETGDQWLK